MKYYIATRLDQIEKHNHIRDLLTQKGHEITYDWTAHGNQKHTSSERLNEIAHLELEGIAQADFVIVLLPGGKGTHTELGLSVGLKKPTLIHSETNTPFSLGEETCAFYYLSQVEQLCCTLDDIEKGLEHFLNSALFCAS